MGRVLLAGAGPGAHHQGKASMRRACLTVLPPWPRLPASRLRAFTALCVPTGSALPLGPFPQRPSLPGAWPLLCIPQQVLPAHGC